MISPSSSLLYKCSCQQPTSLQDTTCYRPGGGMNRVNDLRSSKSRRHRHDYNDMVTGQTVFTKKQKCRLRLNIGGLNFEIMEKNLLKYPDTLLGSDRKLFFYDDQKKEYFFDRDPVIFKYVLDFYRSGKFHISTPDCMEAIREELAFFGIPEAFVSECCCEHIAFEKEEEEELKCTLHSQEHRGRKKLHEFLTDFDSSVWAGFFSYFFVVVVILNICLIVSETLDCDNFTKCRDYYTRFFFILDSFCVAVFTFDYFARLFSCPNRREFVKDYSNTFDLLGILPYYIGIIEKIANTDNDTLTAVITILRIFRIFRVMKLARHSEQFQNLLHSIAQAGGELGGILFSFLALMVVFSTIIFSVEDGGATNAAGFTSIPSAFWYTLVTMTTLGYGDMYPTTLIGKLIGSACALAGVVLLALPVPIIEEKLNENNRKMNRRKESKLATTTQSLTKRIAVSLSSLRSLPKRLRQATSQTSIDIDECFYENVSEIQRKSIDEFSNDESTSGSETIKASSMQLHHSPKTAKHFQLHPHCYVGSYDSLEYSLNRCANQDRIDLDKMIGGGDNNGACANDSRRVNPPIQTHDGKIKTLSCETTDLASDDDNEADEMCNWVSTI